MQFAAKKVFVGRQHEEVDEEELRGVRAQLETASRSARAPVRSKRVEYNATNVLALDLPSLVSTAVISTGEMLRCTCGAVFSSVSKVEGKSWQCEFCRAVNDFSLEEEERPKTETVDYLLSGPKFEHASEDEFTVMFVVDTSGSMCVTQSVEAGKIKLKGGAVQDAEVLAFREHGAAQILPNEQQNVQYVSRLQCVQAAVEAQILALKKSHPRCKGEERSIWYFVSEIFAFPRSWGCQLQLRCHHGRRRNVSSSDNCGGSSQQFGWPHQLWRPSVQAADCLGKCGKTHFLCVQLDRKGNHCVGTRVVRRSWNDAQRFSGQQDHYLHRWNGQHGGWKH